MSPWRTRQVTRKINQGAVFAYPTDTIWGFGCHPLQANAIQRIKTIKSRDSRKGLILLCSNIEFCRYFIDENSFSEYKNLTSQTYSKPVTWIFKASRHCPEWLYGPTATIAIRITNNSLIGNLCDDLTSPLISTSANSAGKTPARNSLLVHKHFRNSLDFIIEGSDTGTHNASEIRDAASGVTIRA